MNIEERASAHFLRSASAHEDAAVILAPALARAAQALAGQLLQDGRIFIAGSAGMEHAARYMTFLLMTRFQRERPALPALQLGADLSVIQRTGHFDSGLARELRTLARSADILVLMTGTDSLQTLTQTLDCAGELQIPVIILANQDESAFVHELPFQDIIYLPAATGSSALCQELQLTSIHALCDLIDLQIFGEEL